jgi:hypothetical protein
MQKIVKIKKKPGMSKCPDFDWYCIYRPILTIERLSKLNYP